MIKTMNAPIRWGILGCGDVTEVKSGPGFYKSAGSALSAVMRRNGALAADYAKRHNVPRSYDSAEALINDPNVDAVYVATPPGSHLDYALMVAEARKPCHMEKPMARSHAECAKMVDAFARSGVPLFVAYYRRALPRFLKVRELIDGGAIGRVTGCTYLFNRTFNPNPPDAWRLSAEQSGGGLLLDVGSHVIDLLDFLIGDFTDFSGSAHSSGAVQVEDIASLQFRTSRNVIGAASWNFADSKDDEQTVISGTEGRISFTIMAHSPIKLERNGQSESFAIADPPHIAQPLIQTVVDDLLGKGKCTSTGISGARTSKVMDAMLEKFYHGRDDEFWKRPQTWGN
jgi:predicted dehydrogenase